MTVQTLWQSAQFAFGQSPDNTRFSDDFYSAVNNSQEEFANSRKWGFLRTSGSLTTTDGTREVSLPDNFGSFYNVRGSVVITSPSANSGDVVQIMTLDEWMNDNWEDGSSEGTPGYMYVEGDNANFSPVPDAEYVVSIKYYKRPADIGNTSDTLTIPDKYSEALKKMVWLRLQEDGYSAVQELQITEDRVQKLIGKAALDDIAKYGSFNFNLNSTTYKRRTV